MILVLALLAALLLPAAPAAAAEGFGLESFDVAFSNADGTPATHAGSHPFAMDTTLYFNHHSVGSEQILLDGNVKDLFVEQPAGLSGDPTAYPTCPDADFLTVAGPFAPPDCPLASAVGIVGTWVAPLVLYAPVFNLQHPPGAAARIGFVVGGLPIVLDLGVKSGGDYNVIARQTNFAQVLPITGARLQLWGDPADPAHDALRGECGSSSGAQTFEEVAFGFLPSEDSCPTTAPRRPFLTLPGRCAGPQETRWEADSWQQPGQWLAGAVLTHDFSEPPLPQGFTGCGKLPFSPAIDSKPTTAKAETASGLDFDLDFDQEGLTSPDGLAQSTIKTARISLPEGLTANPSLAEGIGVCSPADLARETLGSAPGAGCPQTSKIGSVEVQTPLLEGTIPGSVYLAKPYDNLAGDSLLAFYIVLKDPGQGILVKLPAEVAPDPATGRLTTIVEEIPQLPFSHFHFHFREGQRAPLITPPACGTYTTEAELTPWARPDEPITATSSFQIDAGVGGGPCPPPGAPPFHPSLDAGTTNNAAGSFSPFNVHITRDDGEQELTNFSIKLPPGIAAKLAGVPFCPDAAIAAATARTGSHGGQEELDSPSCPAASLIGTTLAGSGVGGALAYAPGKVYLAGPYHGAPISFVAITAGVVGPFDIGTVVVRLAIDVNPETGEVFLDSTGSDPIPHIIKGIVLHLRDIRSYTDRPSFTINPTSCARKSTAATVLGSGLDFVSAADDNPFVSTSPFQAADCAALPFEPKLSLRLIGGTKRGAFPKLKAFLRMRGFGEAGVARAQVTLPRSEFIANAHFQTICTRVQFKEAGGNGEACPAGSIYGWARAKTPILADPLEGPVFLRSSEHELPDVVASLRGQEINVHLVGHVDSVKGQLGNTFETVPDAPVEWASFSFKGGNKGLFENSTDLCKKKNRADVRFTGQNGKTHNYKPAVKVKCKARARHRKHHRQKRAAR